MFFARFFDSPSRRLKRECRTIQAMIALYCRDLHGTPEGLCSECADLFAYASVRLEKCPFGETKPTCVNCTVHCYQPERRDQVRKVMRYAGPRMMLRHPILAIFHLFEGRREAPSLRDRRARAAGARGKSAEGKVGGDS